MRFALALAAAFAVGLWFNCDGARLAALGACALLIAWALQDLKARAG
jgi:small-conductance mechanosensitive channel